MVSLLSKLRKAKKSLQKNQNLYGGYFVKSLNNFVVAHIPV